MILPYSRSKKGERGNNQCTGSNIQEFSRHALIDRSMLGQFPLVFSSFESYPFLEKTDKQTS